MKLKPRHRWFAHTDKEACEDWCGPHKTIEAAFDDCIDQLLVDPEKFPIYVCPGRKMTKAEWGDMEMEDVEFSWEVDTREGFEIKIMRRKDE